MALAGPGQRALFLSASWVHFWARWQRAFPCSPDLLLLPSSSQLRRQRLAAAALAAAAGGFAAAAGGFVAPALFSSVSAPFADAAWPPRGGRSGSRRRRIAWWRAAAAAGRHGRMPLPAAIGLLWPPVAYKRAAAAASCDHHDPHEAI